MLALSMREKQCLFTKNIMSLIQFAYNNGYELTFGDAFRDSRVHGDYGIKKSYSAARSQHKLRLAVDFNIFKDGRYLEGTEHHAMLGEFWETLHPNNRWGGRFKDGNHYEMI